MTTLWLSDAIQGAIESGRSVTIESAEGGFYIAVDGESVTGPTDTFGLPWETFDYPIDHDFPEESRELARDLAKEQRSRKRRRSRKRKIDRLDYHTAAEGKL